MVEDPARRRRAVIESLVVAFSHSEAKDLVGTDALRTVLTGQSRELLVGDELVLQPLWDLLAEQPGFSPELVAPAFCRVESWRDRLGVKVTLPAAMADMPEAERRAACDRCIVPARELATILRGESDTPAPEPITPAPAKKPTTRLSVDDPGTGPHKKKSRERRPGLEAAAAAVALLTFTFAGVTAYRACGTSSGLEEVQVALPPKLPVSETRRLGAELRATLDDPAWQRRPAAERRETLASALRSLRADGIEVLVIVDAQGNEVASAQWAGDSPTPAIRLR